MKCIGKVLATCLLAGFASVAWAVVLPEEVARSLEQRIDTFVGAPGYERLEVESMLDGGWYARFEGAGESALPPDADLDPVTRGLLLFTSQEAPLETARYRITRHQSTPGGEWPDVRHSYIEITRYNLAPVLHRENVAAYGEHAAPAGPEVELPHVGWRLVTTGVMGQRAHVVAASRHVVGPDEALQAMCLDGLACLEPGGFEPGDAIGFVATSAPELEPAGYRGAAFPPDQPGFSIASPVRIAQEMFQVATGEYDELHEGASLAEPEMVVVIDFGVGGQERNSQALMHLTSLMDDATSERWFRRLEVPGAVEWQRFDVPALHFEASACAGPDMPMPSDRSAGSLGGATRFIDTGVESCP